MWVWKRGFFLDRYWILFFLLGWFYPQCAGPLRPSWRNRKPRRSRLKFPDPNRRHCCKSLTRCRLVLRANSYFGSDQRDELCKSLDFPIFQSVQQINCTFITLVSWCWPHQNTLIAQRYQFDSIDLNCSQWFLNCPHRKTTCLTLHVINIRGPYFLPLLRHTPSIADTLTKYNSSDILRV